MKKGGLLLLPLLAVLFLSGCEKSPQEQKQVKKEAVKKEVVKKESKLITKEKKMNDVPAEIDLGLAKSCQKAVIKTNKGEITLKLYNEDAPVTVANFCTLTKKDFYKGVIFHRVIKGFMIQGGDPTGTGTGGPGYKFKDEIHTNNKNNAGTIAMANAGPATNGSQFFINTKDNNFLDAKHTVFGEVVSGMAAVEAIENSEIDALDKPLEDAIIENIIIK